MVDSAQVVIAEAQLEPFIGQRLAITDLRLQPFDDDGLRRVESLADLQGAALMLAGLGQGLSRTYGSAVLVAPGVALAASHVLQQHLNDGLFDSEDGALYAFGVTEAGMTAWQVMTLSFDPEGDAAVLLLAYACAADDPLVIQHFKTGVRLPRVGERVTAVGFRPSDGEQEIHSSSPKLPSTQGTFLLSSGPVLEVWPTGRDRVLAPRPCFAAKVATVGAMSGGPIFNEDGYVIGIVTSSSEDSADYYTIGTMIWDALLMQLDPVWPPEFWPSGKLLKHLLKPEEGGRLSVSEDGTDWVYQAE